MVSAELPDLHKFFSEARKAQILQGIQTSISDEKYPALQVQTTVSRGLPETQSLLATESGEHVLHELQENPSPQYPALQVHTVVSVKLPAPHTATALAFTLQDLHAEHVIPSP